MIIWIAALVVGAVLGWLNIEAVNSVAEVVATVFTRLFQLLAVPTIVLAIVNTMAQMGTGKNTGRLFRHTLTYTLLTTVSAAAVGAILYFVIAPSNLPEELMAQQPASGVEGAESASRRRSSQRRAEQTP